MHQPLQPIYLSIYFTRTCVNVFRNV